MPRWLLGQTGRFRERPHYAPGEIDHACESLVREFLTKHRGKVDYPLTTDDLTVLIEQHVRTLDVYADLSSDGDDVEGVARFAVGLQPVIEVATALSSDERRSNRFRTTLSHELGHAKLHDPIFQAKFASADLFASREEERIVCKRDKIVRASASDWMEWQAGYASGAYLMPKSAVAGLLGPYLAGENAAVAGGYSTNLGTALIDATVTRFAVSREAARIRLQQLGYSTGAPVRTLFG